MVPIDLPKNSESYMSASRPDATIIKIQIW